MQQKTTMLITNVESNTVTIMDESNHHVKTNIPVGTHPHEVAVTPNGRYALVSNYGDLSGKKPGSTLTSIDVVNQRVIETVALPDHCRPHGLAFISDHLALVTAQGIQALLVLHFDDEFKKGRVINTIQLPCSGAHMVTISKDHQHAYVGCFSGSICKIDISNPESKQCDIREIKVGDNVAGVALSQDEMLVFGANMSMKNSMIAVVNTTDMTLVKNIKTRLGPTRIQLFNDGKSALIIDSIAGKAEVLDINSLTITQRFNTTNTHSHQTGRFCGGFFGALPVPVNAVIKNDNTAYLTNLYAGNVAHIDLRNGIILETFAADVSPDGICLSYR